MKKNIIRILTTIMLIASCSSVLAISDYEPINITQTFEDGAADGWSTDGNRIYVTEVTSDNKALKIESDENGNTTVKGLENNFERYVMVEFDIYYTGQLEADAFLPIFKNSANKEMFSIKLKEDGKVSLVRDNKTSSLGTMNENEWNHFRFNLDMQSGILAIAFNDDMPMGNASFIKATYPSSLSSLEFAFDGVGEIFIDNFVIKNTGRIFEAFDNGTKAEVVNAGVISDHEYSFEIAENPMTENDYCVMSYEDPLTFAFPAITERGTIEFDIMFDNIAKSKPSILFDNKSNVSARNAAALIGNTVINQTDYSSNTWYHIRTDIDAGAQSYTYSISEVNGSEPIYETSLEFNGERDYIDMVTFDGGTKFYIDNFEAWDKTVSAPQVTAVTATDKNGEEIEGVSINGGEMPTDTEAVSIDVSVTDEGKGIEALFSSESVSDETVYFFDMKENRKVKLSNLVYDEDAGRISLNLGEYLNVNNDYRLVADGIKNTLGYKMTSPLKLKLQPIPEKVLADMDKATAVKTAEGVDIEIPVINYSGDEQPLKVVAIICSADGMAKQTPAMMTDAVPVSDDTYLVQKGFSTTEPAEAGDSVKLLVWDENNVPVCDEIVIAITD